MNKSLLSFIFLFTFGYTIAQTKVGGQVFDENNEPLAYVNVLFKGSIEGTITDENGRFYLESKKTWKTLIVSFLGYETIEIQHSEESKFTI